MFRIFGVAAPYQYWRLQWSTLSMGAVRLLRALRVSWTLCVLCCANVPVSVGFASLANLGSTTDPRLVGKA